MFGNGRSTDDPFWHMQQQMHQMHSEMMRAFQTDRNPQPSRPMARVQEVDDEGEREGKGGHTRARAVPIIEEPEGTPH